MLQEMVIWLQMKLSNYLKNNAIKFNYKKTKFLNAMLNNFL